MANSFCCCIGKVGKAKNCVFIVDSRIRAVTAVNSDVEFIRKLNEPLEYCPSPAISIEPTFYFSPTSDLTTKSQVSQPTEDVTRIVKEIDQNEQLQSTKASKTTEIAEIRCAKEKAYKTSLATTHSVLSGAMLPVNNENTVAIDHVKLNHELRREQKVTDLSHTKPKFNNFAPRCTSSIKESSKTDQVQNGDYIPMHSRVLESTIYEKPSKYETKVLCQGSIAVAYIKPRY